MYVVVCSGFFHRDRGRLTTVVYHADDWGHTFYKLNSVFFFINTANNTRCYYRRKPVAESFLAPVMPTFDYPDDRFTPPIPSCIVESSTCVFRGFFALKPPSAADNEVKIVLEFGRFRSTAQSIRLASSPTIHSRRAPDERSHFGNNFASFGQSRA